MHSLTGKMSPRHAQVQSTAELALNFELTTQWSLPASPEHSRRMMVLPLQERAAVLRQAVRALQPHMLAGELLPARETPLCKSLIPGREGRAAVVGSGMHRLQCDIWHEPGTGTVRNVKRHDFLDP